MGRRNTRKDASEGSSLCQPGRATRAKAGAFAYSQGAPRGQRPEPSLTARVRHAGQRLEPSLTARVRQAGGLEPSLTVFGGLMHMEQLAGNIQYDESAYD